MKTRHLITGSVLFLGLLSSGVMISQEAHPNIAAADHLIDEAIGKIDAAQEANRDKLGGHAQRAKELLQQAKGELREAEEYAGHHH